MLQIVARLLWFLVLAAGTPSKAGPAFVAPGGADGGMRATGPYVTGAPEPVFLWRRDACARWDVPDAPARAWRGADGRVRLVAGAEESRALVGPDLGQLRRDCAVLHRGAGSDDPAAANDRSWIAAVRIGADGEVMALTHEEFHGHLRPALCPVGAYLACWRNAVGAAASTDGGRSFRRVGRPVAALPIPYDGFAGRRTGYFNPSNIVREGEHLYAFVFSEAAGSQRRGPCLLRRAVAPARAPASAQTAGRGRYGSGAERALPDQRRTDPADQASAASRAAPPSGDRLGALTQGEIWRGGDGLGAVSNNPDGGAATEGADLSEGWFALGADGNWAPLAGSGWRPCAPLAGLSSTVSTVVRRGPDGPWLMATPAVLPGPDGAPVAGVWTAVSHDLRRWSRPRLLWAAPLLWARDCGEPHAWAYPSFIDADAPDANFEEVDEAFHLYIVRAALGPDCRTGPERDLMRLPVSWPRAAPER